MLRDGLVIPPHLDTPHAVSFVLTQKRGQLKMKHVQKGLLTTSESERLLTHLSRDTIEMQVRGQSVSTMYTLSRPQSDF